MTHKAGYISIIGNPNVGKSTLMNAILGQDLSITTPKAQTTRHRILGILNDEDYQIVFSDTPGVIKPAYALQESMMDFVKSTFEDTDLVFYLVEPGEKALKDEALAERLKTLKQPLYIIINKIDLVDEPRLIQVVEFWQKEYPNALIFPLSALNNFNVKELVQQAVKELPESPPFFDKEDLSDRHERFFVEEIIREQILLNYKKEIPYAVEVKVEAFTDEPDINRIRATIYTERNTQKGIIVGRQGSMIKRTGTEARKKMERFFNKKVFLDLHVKVRKNWRQNEQDLKRFGYRS